MMDREIRKIGVHLCPICGGKLQELFRSRFYPVQKCLQPGCGHLTPAWYEEEIGLQEVDEDEERFSKNYKRYAGMINVFVSRGLLHDASRFLDVGCGPGNYLRTLRNYCSNPIAYGIERGMGIDRIAEKFDLMIVSGFEGLPKGLEFDFATCIEVVEHVPDPVDFLKSIRARMSDGACLFLTTPSGWVRDNDQVSKLPTYETPRHIQFYTKKSLHLALFNAGFSRVEFEFFETFYSGNFDLSLETRSRHMRGALRLQNDEADHFTVFAWN